MLVIMWDDDTWLIVDQAENKNVCQWNVFNAIYDRELAPRIRREFCDFSKSIPWFFHFCTVIFVQPYLSAAIKLFQSLDYSLYIVGLVLA